MKNNILIQLKFKHIEFWHIQNKKNNNKLLNISFSFIKQRKIYLITQRRKRTNGKNKKIKMAFSMLISKYFSSLLSLLNHTMSPAAQAQNKIANGQFTFKSENILTLRQILNLLP